MLKTIETGNHLGRALGAALVLCATAPAAMGDCSNTSADKEVHYVKVEVFNDSGYLFDAYLYQQGPDDPGYGNADEVGGVKPGDDLKHDFNITAKNDESKNTLHIKVDLKVPKSGAATSGGAVQADEVVASCEYYITNSGNHETGWYLTNNSGVCTTDNLADYCKDCKIQCTKDLSSPESSQTHWSTKFTITD